MVEHEGADSLPLWSISLWARRFEEPDARIVKPGHPAEFGLQERPHGPNDVADDRGMGDVDTVEALKVASDWFRAQRPSRIR